ncbi:MULTISPECIES: hypothetical protein [unclassified Bradyrhizobium]|uniref:hypothetical protein n=1 Tax=unclassified Bradyrhizobium TaxID=2631580 RepID=UPI0029164906|nr:MULTISPECIES: hypothetical protein [unclassified Bradyrhizobium]
MKTRLKNEAKSHEVQVQPTLPSKAHEALLMQVFRAAKHSFDSKSRTHIFFCSLAPGVVPRGVGEYPDGAYADFQRHAAEAVKVLTPAKVKSLSGTFDNVAAASEPVEVEEKREPTPQIALSTSNSLHTHVASAAEQASLSLNKFCVELLEREFPLLNKRSFDMSSADVRKMIMGVKAASGSEKHSWVIRVPRELRARILVFANEYKLSAPQVCVFLLGSYFDKHPQRAPEFVAAK